MPSPVSLVYLPTTCAADVASSEGFMEKSAANGRGFAGFDPQRCGAFLRGRHPEKTAIAVEAETGVPAKTVERWLGQTPSAPSLPAFGALVAAYGPAFLAACFPGLAWLERAAALATYEGLDRELMALHARREALARELTGRRT